MTNVLGDALGAAVVAHLSRDELRLQDLETNNKALDGELSPLTSQDNNLHGQKETKFWSM